MLADTVISALPSTRPNFGKRQIKNMDQISKDQLIILCGTVGDYRLKVRVTEGPYRCNRTWCLDYEFRSRGITEHNTLSLADYSVIRHDDGSWNPGSWLEKA